jgi:tetratricopeptide (TPR) repeat protein
MMTTPLKTMALLILACWLGAAPAVGSGHKGDHRWWLAHYGQVTAAENPAIKRAMRVFDRVWSAAQPVDITRPRLLFLPSSSEKWLDSWALALADGSILIVESLLPLVYDNDHPLDTLGDTRMAFILSHELAHLIRHDHERIGDPQFFGAGSDPTEHVRQVEMDADYHGLFLLTMAGYQPQRVLNRQTPFFEHYAARVAEQIATVGRDPSSARQPERRERVDGLFTRLHRFAGELVHFRNGVDAYTVGDYSAAEKHFRSFLDTYPGREVFNNLGLSLYQQARTHLSACGEPRYQLSPTTVLVKDTDARRLVPKTIGRIEIRADTRCRPNLARPLLTESRRYLETAAAKDPTFQPARINLEALSLIEKPIKETAGGAE